MKRPIQLVSVKHKYFFVQINTWKHGWINNYTPGALCAFRMYQIQQGKVKNVKYDAKPCQV